METISSKVMAGDVYNVNEIYDFKVKRNYGTFCELIDTTNDIICYLKDTADLQLFKGLIIKCKVLAVVERRPKIELINQELYKRSNATINEESLYTLLDNYGITWNTNEFVKLILQDDRGQSFESLCNKWIQNLIKRKENLTDIRRDCFNILERSEFLNLCKENERDYYQERFTILLEHFGYYITVEEFLSDDEGKADWKNPESFIESLFDKLSKSGFVYHPTKNFSILSCLFQLKPELMQGKVEKLLEIIRSRNINVWKKEPFRTALVKVIELYIREIDGLIDKTKDNQLMISNCIQALSLQLLLYDKSLDAEICDYAINSARLCTVSSYVKNMKAENLVGMAFQYLFNPEKKMVAYKLSDTGTELIPFYLSNTYKDDKINTVNSYVNNQCRLLVTDNGIQLYSLCGGVQGNRAIFPKELGLWKNLQIFLEEKPALTLSVRPDDISPYQKLWEDIEISLYKTTATINSTLARKKKGHRVDDIVQISFIKEDPTDQYKFLCRIEDEKGGDGYIYLNDIVGYSLVPKLRYFMSDNGERLIFKARIIETDEDVYHFSMLEEIKEEFQDMYSDDELILCSVGNKPNTNGFAPAVSDEGLSVSIVNASDFDNIERNSLVWCKQCDKGNGTFHIACRMLDFCNDEDFDLVASFRFLMKEYANDTVRENNTTQEEQIFESDRILDESYIKELIYMIDRMALIDKEYVKSYNYLGFARILCLMIGWESQATYYKGRMDIITMLHYFAVNSKVDEEKLKNLENANEELFANNSILRQRFRQLKIVSFAGKPEYNNELFEYYQNYPLLKGLASLVLAYNIAKETRMEGNARDIHNRIKQELNLKGFESGLQKYGTGIEDEHTEYKTSIVFDGADKSGYPNMKKQMDEILKVINSFMNTRGGSLYIGVNDFGLGVGLENDLEYKEFYGNKEKYKRTIINAVATHLGKLAYPLIELDYDDNNKDKDVLIVTVKPCQTGIPYEGYWWVRFDSTKWKLNKAEFDGYQKSNRFLKTKNPNS